MILPYLLMDRLGHLTGVPGLFVAAVFGAALRLVARLRKIDVLQLTPESTDVTYCN